MEQNEDQNIIIKRRFSSDSLPTTKRKKKRNLRCSLFRKKTLFVKPNLKKSPTHIHSRKRFSFNMFNPKKNKSTGVNNGRKQGELIKLNLVKCLSIKKIVDDLYFEDELYGRNKDQNIPTLIKKFKNVVDCSIIKYGVKESSDKIEYTFCKTCDSNLIYPICIPCIKKCHKDHKINEIIKIGNIKCACGANLHRINYKQKNLNYEYKCLGYEWDKTAKLNFQYKSFENKNVCEFCKYICCNRNVNNNTFQNSKFKSEKNPIDTIENGKQDCLNCECSNEEIHKDRLKNMQFIIIFFFKYNNIYKKLLHPLQIINMIFKTNKSFEKVFSDIFDLINFLNEPIKKIKSVFEKYNTIDITKTKLYLSLIFFRKLINNLSHKKLYYFCSETKKYFNFDNLKKLYMCRPKDEKSFLIFMKEYLYLFKKIYINYNIKFCIKYKINDLENFSCIQRIILLKDNTKEFTEAEEIATFFLECLTNFENITYSYVEYLNCIYQIVSIIYKLSSYKLISINSLIKFLIKIEKIFDLINYIRNCIISKDMDSPNVDMAKSNIRFYTINYSTIPNANILDIQRIITTDDRSRKILFDIEIKIFYNIIKLLYYTLYYFNDKIIENILYDNQKDIKKIFEKKNFSFLFNKNELGSIIFKQTIIILSSVQNNYKNKNKKQSKIYRIIFRNSMKILEHSLCNNDIYFSNIIRSINNVEKYHSFFIINNESFLKSEIYLELSQEKNKISLSYENFFIFKITKEELITNINKSLSNVLGEDHLNLLANLNKEDFTPISFQLDKNNAILITKYYSEISNIIEIITYNYYKSGKKKGKTINFFDTNVRNSHIYNNKNSNQDIHLISLMENENYKNVFDKLILFYFCFSFESSDNSLLVLSHYILNELIKLPLCYGYLLFKLFHLCILNIASIDFMLIDGKVIIKNLYKFLQKLITLDGENVPICVLYFLKILEIISYKIKNFHSDFVYIIQKYIFLLHNDYQLSYKYYELAMNEKIQKIELNEAFSSEESSNENQKHFSMILNKNIKMDIDSLKDRTEKNQYSENNIIKNSFNIYIKLLNDVFDFSIVQDRKKVKFIVDINKVIYLLKYCKISMSIRTELLKFSRKILIDITYSEDKNDTYTKIIINDEDNLVSLKNNPLSNNPHYPTKYLSFIQDFYNLSARENLIEKYDFFKSLKLIKQYPIEKISNKFLKMSVVSKNTSILSNDALQTPINTMIFNNSIILNNQLKDSNKDNNKDSYKEFTDLDKRSSNKSNFDNNKEKENSQKCFSSKNVKNNILNCTLNSKTKRYSVNTELFPIVEGESSKELKAIKNRSPNNQLNESECVFDTSSGSECSSIESNKSLNNKNEEIKNNNSYKDNLIKSPITPKIKKCTFQIPRRSYHSNNLESENEVNFLPCFDEVSYEILKNELENLTNHINDEYSFIMEDDEIVKEDLRNYLENGLLIPIIYFFKKSFSLIHNFTGHEVIKLFYLVEQSINLKLYISKFNSNLWEEEEHENEFSEETINDNKDEFKLKYILNINIKNNQGISMIKGKYFKNKKLVESTYKSLDLIKSKKISIFDYMSLYQIVENEFFYMLKSKKTIYFDETFENEKKVSLKLKKKIKELTYENEKNGNIEKNINIKCINIYLEYIYSKIILINEKNSSLINILNEIDVINETYYRNILINILIYNCTSENLFNEYRTKSYCILYKLMLLKTSEIQTDIISMISDDEENNKNNFMNDFSNDLLEQIIKLLIEYLNPLNRINNSHYLPTYILIKIFKLFCQDRNYFFQNELIRLLSYKYANIIPFYYKSLKLDEINKKNGMSGNKEDEEELKKLNSNNINSVNQVSENSSSEDRNENVKFFDFFLYVVIKIILISNWDKFDYKNDEDQNSFLHKLFYTILEMLNEIIQGNKLIISFMLEEGNVKNKIIADNKTPNKPNLITTKIKSNKNAINIFLKYVCQVLIIDNSNIDLLYEIKINIIEFILSLIEAKISNKNIQRELLKHLKINKVLSIIINIFKNFYLNKKNQLKNSNTLIINQEENIKNNTNVTKDLKSNKNINKKNKFKAKNIQKEKLQKSLFYNKESAKCSSPKNESTSFPLTDKNINVMNLLNFKPKNSEINSNSCYPNSTSKLQSNIQGSELKSTVNENLILKNLLYERKQLLKNLSISKKSSIIKNSNIINSETSSVKLISIKKDFNWDFKSKQNDESEIMKHKESRILYDNKLYEFFIHEFVNIKTFRKTKEFILTSLLYKYVKIISIVNESIEIKEIMSKVHSTKIKLIKEYDNDFIDNFLKASTENETNNKSHKQISNKKNNKEILATKNFKKFITKSQLTKKRNKEEKNYDEEFIEKFYIIKFFESIINIIEVRSSEDNTNQLIIFTKIPEMIHLSEYSKNEFEHHVNRENEICKKNDLMKNIKYFMAEIKYFEKNQKYLESFRNINLKIFPIICYIYALILNLVLLLIIEGDDIVSAEDSIKFRRKNKILIRHSINISFSKYNNLLNTLNLIYVLLNGIIICLWIYFRLPFLYKLEKIKYMENNQNKKKLNFSSKLYIIFIMIFLKRHNILTIIYQFIVAIINILIRGGEILYTLYLLPIITISPTLKHIMVSVKLRYQQIIVLSFFLFCIVIYTLTNIAFFFFNSDYEDELDYYDDNYCKTLIFCLLNSLDSGLRARGGIGDSGKRLSFVRNSKRYIGRLILDTIFFMLIVIFLTSMVFGVIIESFLLLNQKENKYLTDRRNFCFICNGNRSVFERHKINFQKHIEHTHNLWDYVEYIIYIKQNTFQELNTVNSYIKKKIENNDISWLPTYTDFINKNDDNENDDATILEENAYRYKIQKKKNF